MMEDPSLDSCSLNPKFNGDREPPLIGTSPLQTQDVDTGAIEVSDHIWANNNQDLTANGGASSSSCDNKPSAKPSYTEQCNVIDTNKQTREGIDLYHVVLMETLPIIESQEKSELSSDNIDQHTTLESESDHNKDADSPKTTFITKCAQTPTATGTASVCDTHLNCDTSDNDDDKMVTGGIACDINEPEGCENNGNPTDNCSTISNCPYTLNIPGSEKGPVVAVINQSRPTISDNDKKASNDAATDNDKKAGNHAFTDQEESFNHNTTSGADHPHHDVHVDIISGPLATSESRSDDIDVVGSSSHTINNLQNAEDMAVESNRNDDDDNDDDSSIRELDLSGIEPFDDDDNDVDPELLEVNDLHPGEQEPQPLYEVGPSVSAECEICLEHNLMYLRLCCGTPICDQCMTTYLESVIRTGKVKIECPGLCQQKYIHREEITGRISLEMKEKYYKFLVDANNEPHIKTCPRCSHVLQVELAAIRNPRVKKKGLLVTCPECALEWCFTCQAPWHEGISCKDHRKGNKLLKKWAQTKFLGQHNAQRCPRCKVYIQRISGCDHMTCSKCDTSFCYRCGERYLHLRCIGDHYSRFSIFGCKYIYKPDNPTQRKLIRGSIFGAKLVAAPVVGVLAVGVGSVLLTGALFFFLPCYGVRKFQNHRRQERRRRAAAEEMQRWRRKLEEIHNAGDPYIAEYNRLNKLGVSPSRLVVAARTHQTIRGPSVVTDEEYNQRADRIRKWSGLLL